MTRWKLAVAGAVVGASVTAGALAATLGGSSPSHPVQVFTQSGVTGSTTTTSTVPTTVAPATTVPQAPATTAPAATTTTVPTVIVPNVVSDLLATAESVLTQAGLRYAAVGNGEYVGSQSVVAGSRVPENSTITLVMVPPPSA